MRKLEKKMQKGIYFMRKNYTIAKFVKSSEDNASKGQILSQNSRKCLKLVKFGKKVRKMIYLITRRYKIDKLDIIDIIYEKNTKLLNLIKLSMKLIETVGYITKCQ